MVPADRIQTLKIATGDAVLEGDLQLPRGAHGLVLFAHGSGSSRLSARNRFVADQLRARGVGTLLMDLLTADEEKRDAVDAHLRFDIPMLARRLGEATDWLGGQGIAERMPLGYFGASTGAAAALIAASTRHGQIAAVVSRGGRVDLAASVLDRVRAPTLFIVGSRDAQVLALNQAALGRLAGPKELAIVAGATHLFPEPGALEEVARLAGEWFALHLRAGDRPGVGVGP